MSERPHVFLFGHSFLSRLSREAQREHRSVRDFIGVPDRCSLFVEGHPGLTYQRLFSNADHYLKEMMKKQIDILILDMGTNDLCNPEVTPARLVQNNIQLLNLLETRGINPQCIVILSIIQRSKISRTGQVDLTTFNHRVRRFNSMISRDLKEFPRANIYAQRRVNYPKYLVDGCHLTREGLTKYCQGLKEAILRNL